MDKPEQPLPPRRKAPYMTLVTWIVIVGAVAAFLLVKRLTQVNPAAAREWLNKGALVIDVRSKGEFDERHLPGAINIPLDRLGEDIARYAPNKEQPLLLHCLSGTRSGMGTSTLRKMGYQHVFNLGSYGRAEKIVGGLGEPGKKG
jgi:phage shock protein E